MDRMLVLYDYGGVLVDSPLERIARYARRYDVDARVAQEAVFGKSESGEHPWHELECGVITYDEYVQRYNGQARRLGLSMPCPSLHVIYDLAPRRSLLGRIGISRSPSRLIGIATNNVREMRDMWRAQVQADKFDVVFDSSELGVRKPSKEFFSAIGEFCGGVDVKTSHVTIVDDVPANVTAAESWGFHGLLADATEEALISSVAARGLVS